MTQQTAKNIFKREKKSYTAKLKELIKIALRPEKRLGSDDTWDRAENALREALKSCDAEWTELPGEGAFYGPKFEYVLKDAIGREWQCGTTQVDFNVPERFGAFYIDHDGSKKAPVMVHRAICGSMERFIGILIEHYAGNFLLWLAPTQLVFTTITSEGDEYAKVVAAAARRAGLRVEIDLRNEKINYKVREHSLAKVPVIIAVGKREAADGDRKDVCTISVDEQTTSVYAAFTCEQARHEGVSTALLAHALEHARACGYQRCAVPFEPMNPLGSRFWLRYFQPVCYSFLRNIDERLIPGD